ncbi:hypothetical protein DQG23_19750 [Paenibacillus contaminans]|uniref:Neutral/alkaline non-lysosomal ceramidase N-terminal domain-containing protein n=2 Tax=Paenibacillus contaminans TaxID=450362 RepID=A0A329MIR5_9BACL|nr:hypothetical protein DQG23_19750 [Paenibacillus contaminans]
MVSALYAGTARVIITPPLGCRLDGSYSLDFAEHILDDLFANVVVLDDGCVEVVLIAADVTSIPGPTVKEIAERIEQTCGISKHHVIITPSHTHSSTSMGTTLLGKLPVHWDYVESVKLKMVEAVDAARRAKQPVRLGVGRSSNPNHVFNRRLTAPDGSIRMNWVKDDLDGCVSEGIVDPEMLVIKLVDENGRAVAFLVNYAMHNNAVGRPNISADISGHMTKVLQSVYGESIVVLFLPGACGDINFIDFRTYEWGNPENYKKIGLGLAGTIMELDPVLYYPEELGLSMTYTAVNIAERLYTDRDTKEDATFGTAATEPFFAYYKEARAMHGHEEPGSHEFTIYCLTIGSRIALLTNPAELFVELGLEIKQASPYDYTFLATLTNGLAGYVPTREAFARGGYEIRKMPVFSYLELDAGERFVQASLALLQGKA